MRHIVRLLFAAALAWHAVAAGYIAPAAAQQGRGQNHCAAADVYWYNNGYGTLDEAHQEYIGYLICTLSRAGFLGAIDVLYAFATSDATVALTNLATINYAQYGTPLLYNAVAYGSPTFTPDYGYAGVDGSTTVYIDSGLVISGSTNCTAQAVPNSLCGAFVWSSTNTTPTLGGVAVGSTTDSGCTSGIMAAPSLADGHGWGSGMTTTQLDAGVNSATGPFNVLGLYSSGQVTFIDINGTQVASNILTQSAAPSGSVSVLACNANGSIKLGDGNQIAIVAVGFVSNSACSIFANYMYRVNGTAPPC